MCTCKLVKTISRKVLSVTSAVVSADFLMKDPRPEPEALYLPQAKSILAEDLECEGTPSKRMRID